MRIYEYEAKALYEKHGIPILCSILAHNIDEVLQAARTLSVPVVLKPQTLIKARGKAGLIAFAEDPEQAAQAAERLFGVVHHGEDIEQVLVEEKVDLETEFYIGITPDYTNAFHLVIVSPSGGIAI